jgi:hypothetical protein
MLLTDLDFDAMTEGGSLTDDEGSQSCLTH